MKRSWKKILAVSLLACGIGANACSQIGGEQMSDLALTQKVWVFNPARNSGNYWETGTTYTPESSSLKALEQGGFHFKSNGEYVSYANTSFCGTPPVIYGEYKGGTWQYIDQKRIAVKSTYWQQGEFLYDTLEVVSEKPDELVLRSLRK